jgi:FtsP/CotA-like multicopper oxidase with cupredoxin domain
MSGRSRREVLASGAALGAAALLARARDAMAQAAHHQHHQHPTSPTSPATPGAPAAPPAAPLIATSPRARTEPPPGWRDDGTVITPNGRRAPWRTVGGVKVFHLVAEAFLHEIAPGLVVECWGYNGSTPGPTIEVTEGDRCRFYVTNRLPAPTSVHWHGVQMPNGMDGVSGLTQPPIPPGATFAYEFTFKRAGTFMYHPHYDEMTQIALGMTGMIAVHPRGPRARVRDYALMLHEWQIEPGARRPDPLAMQFNVLTLNSRAFPGTAPLVAEVGDRVRIRLGNLSPMDHHPMHIHGPAFRVVETDGGAIARGNQRPETTVLVPVGSVRVVELTASDPGDWPFHCHMTHHIMNQMGHALGNMVGTDVTRSSARIEKLVPGYMAMGQAGMGEMSAMKMPTPDNSIPMVGGQGRFGLIDMGGMFTLVKVRDRLRGDGDPGWYEHPAGTVATAASAADLRRDGVDPDAPPR